MTAAVAVASPSRPTVRRSRASFPAQVWLEARKSVSTRSGLAVVAASALLAPIVLAVVAAASSEPLDNVVGPLVVTGMLTSLALISLGVLATAGEWTHGSVQTTYLLEPRRSRVLAAKAVAVGAIGAVAAAVADLGVLPLLQTFKPALADKIDRGNAVLSLDRGDKTAPSVTILAVWVGAALVAGAVMTRRRAVQ